MPAEDITIRTVAAIRIQTAWRGKAGKLALRRLVRMRALKVGVFVSASASASVSVTLSLTLEPRVQDFRVRDRNLVLMREEDGLSALWEKKHKCATRLAVAFRKYRRRMFFYAAMQAKYRVRKMEWAVEQIQVSISTVSFLSVCFPRA